MNHEQHEIKKMQEKHTTVFHKKHSILVYFHQEKIFNKRRVKLNGESTLFQANRQDKISELLGEPPGEPRFDFADGEGSMAGPKTGMRLVNLWKKMLVFMSYHPFLFISILYIFQKHCRERHLWKMLSKDWDCLITIFPVAEAVSRKFLLGRKKSPPELQATHHGRTLECPAFWC